MAINVVITDNGTAKAIVKVGRQLRRNSKIKKIASKPPTIAFFPVLACDHLDHLGLVHPGNNFHIRRQHLLNDLQFFVDSLGRSDRIGP